MTFVSLKAAPVRRAIDRLVGAERVTVVIGAGVSRDAGLPDWGELVQRLLRRTAEHRGGFDADAEKLWIEQTIERDQYLGSSAVIAALRTPQMLETWIANEVYDGKGPEAWAPGPAAKAIAELVGAFDRNVRLVTLNYDDLIEQALETRFADEEIRVIASGTDGDPDAGELTVTHLHGYAGRDGVRGPLVISEEQYAEMQQGQSWQEALMVDALNTSTCLFLGTSLNDPNLIRYLYGHDRQEELRHVALFVRQAARTDVETLVRKFREEAVAARWKRCDVAAAFVEHYGDVPQFVHEAARSRTQGDAYRAVETRTAAWIRDVERTILGTADDHAFRESQAQLSEYLRVALAEGVNAAAEAGADLSEEVLAVGLWLVSEDGTSFTNWVTSDRAYQQTATMSPIRIAADPKWVAIEAFTRGVLIEQTRDVYASRWRYIRGLPLRVDQESLGGVLVGAVTITSTKPKDESALEAMPDAVKAAFNDILMSAAKSVFEPAA